MIAEQRRDQPAGMCPPPEQGQRDQEQQGKPLHQGDREQIPARPRQTADIADDQQAGQEHQQVVQRRQAADGRVARPQMLQKERQDRRLGEQRRRPAASRPRQSGSRRS